MKRILFGSSLIGALLLGSCNQITAAQQTILPHRTIIFVWDGMRPDAISQTDTPNLYALQQKGVKFADNHSTYPTFTMMNAASFATGSFPGTTGFYGNTLWQPGPTGKDASGANVDFQQPAFTEDYAILQDLDAFYQGQLLLVGTLFQAAQKAGLKTAAIGKSGPAFLQDYKRGGTILDERHVWPASVAKGLQAAGIKLPILTPVAYPNGDVTLSADNGNPTAGKSKATLNDKVSSDPTVGTTELNADANTYMMSAYLNYILPTQKPDLSLIWLRSPDSTEHSYGVGTPAFRDALHTQDALLGQLQAKLKTLGYGDDTNIIVVSDHGHSNVAGDTAYFPLRSITGGQTGAVDAANGYSVSGDVRTADLMTRQGFKAFDGSGCINDPVMSGIKADGSVVYAPKTDVDGSICGKAGTVYTTPSYRVPATVPSDAFVIAANGGSDYLYNPAHDPVLVAKAVKFLQSREEYGAIFVDDRYNIPGTLPMSRVRLENTAGRNPDIMVSFSSNPSAVVQGFTGTEYESAGNNRGMHGSFGVTDVHNTLVAAGPNFRSGASNTLPTGNVDVAPTVAAIFGVPLPQADGRVLNEALVGGENLNYPVQSQTVTPTSSATGLSVARPTDPDGKDLNLAVTSYSINLQTKTLTQNGKTYTYFDSAAAVRK
ncbi:alkaline phosphatase family protein [Deinococcus ruber]|uniref:Nucleotide pyrophosphatase n=1 Tax=Deinococcus ruber TaxID=1848197 RepID=A0A918CIW4_9DEIO|nr:alkaline phosphatase family protein [Deinococcus ruber]GGR23928.1 nucleotide pyrophosphatase [Deinococcus ruber]